MRFAIFSDIHSNLHALDAVLEDAQKQSCTNLLCLGDIVGYNAFPSECLSRVRALNCPVVKGNHDEEASILKKTGTFNAFAEIAIEYSRQHLSDEEKEWLRGLRFQRQIRDFTIVHASLDTPQNWNYIFNQLDAIASFNYQHSSVCFIGHTHLPKAYIRDGSVQVRPFDSLQMESGKKYLINVGSVGQPRDGDWRSAYCIYDTDENHLSLRRVEYDLAAAQQAVRNAGLPEKLADRLAIGK